MPFRSPSRKLNQIQLFRITTALVVERWCMRARRAKEFQPSPHTHFVHTTQFRWSTWRTTKMLNDAMAYLLKVAKIAAKKQNEKKHCVRNEGTAKPSLQKNFYRRQSHDESMVLYSFVRAICKWFTPCDSSVDFGCGDFRLVASSSNTPPSPPLPSLKKEGGFTLSFHLPSTLLSLFLSFSLFHADFLLLPPPNLIADTTTESLILSRFRVIRICVWCRWLQIKWFIVHRR